MEIRLNVEIVVLIECFLTLRIIDIIVLIVSVTLMKIHL